VEDVEFKECDLHVHFPAGAIPKDGPSAGAAVTLAIASVLSRRRVRRDIALTGEMTLRGKVLEIGGVKEKVMAAYRAGLRQVILPKANGKDLRGIPDEVVNSMMFTYVSTMDEIIRLALLPKGPGTLADAVEPHGDVAPKNAVSDSATASINQSRPAGAVTQ
jgi:ATP-dependent Lon protease